MENRELIALALILVMALGLVVFAIRKLQARRKFELRQQGRGKATEVNQLQPAE